MKPAPDIDAVHGKGADERVHDGREGGATLAVGPEAQPTPDHRIPEAALGFRVVHRNPGMVDEDAQSLAVADQGTQHLRFARAFRQGVAFRLRLPEQRLDSRRKGVSCSASNIDVWRSSAGS